MAGRRILTVAAAFTALSTSTPAIAAGENLSWLQATAPSPEGGAGFPGPDVSEADSRGLVNMWSWDYGPKAKDPSHRHWPAPFGFALLNFAIFAAILYRLAANPLKAFVLERHDSIRKQLDEAARLRAEAQTKLAECEAKVNGVEREIESLLSAIRQDAEREKAHLIAAAEQQAKRLRDDAARQIEAEIERARQELRRSVVEAAVASAETILKRQVRSDDQHRMAERYVRQIEGALQSNKRTS